MAGRRRPDERPLGRDELAEAVGQLVSRHTRLIEVELVEQQPVERATQRFAGSAVAGLGIAEQVEGEREELVAGLQTARRVTKLALKFGPVMSDAGKLLLELRLRPVGVAEQLDVAVLLRAETAQAVAEPLSAGAEPGQLLLERVVELCPDGRTEGGAQPDAGVVPLDGPLDTADGEVRQRAGVLLPTAAEEVEVGAAVAPAAGQDQPPTAAAAPQVALEVVVVGALPSAAASMQRQDALNPIEQLRLDQGLMAAGVLLAPVDDDADVIAVAE